MNRSRKSALKLGFTAVVVLTLVALFINVPWRTRELPVYNPKDVNPDYVDFQMRGIANDHKVSDFTLINQNGDTITQEDYSDKIYVTDFFFTRCPTICPVMSKHMAQVQEKYLDNERVKLLSLSVTPDYDSVPVLNKYANRYGAISSKWNITTGNKSHIYELARKSYFAVMNTGDGLAQDFIHSSNFILIDTQKQIRGIYEGTKEEELNRLFLDINSLLNTQ
jgi:protein SCO1/2